MRIELTKPEKMENALKLIYFELSTMPPLPGFSHIPFGIINSMKVAKEALEYQPKNENEQN